MDRQYDYRYIVGIEGPEGVMYVNNFNHWKDTSGVCHVKRVDLATTPVMIPDLARAKAVARTIKGRIWRVRQEDMDNDAE